MKINTDNSSQTKLPKLFSSAVLKYVAALFMFIDHAAVAMMQIVYASKGTEIYANVNVLTKIYNVMRHIGRFSFPVFCFFIVEGYCRTRSRSKYLLKLIVFGVISQIPFEKALFTEASISKGNYLNVFFTLALGLMSIWLMDAVLFGRYAEIPERIKNWPIVLRALLVVAAIVAICYISNYFHTDYRYGGILVIIVLYLLWSNPGGSCSAAYVVLCAYNKSEVWCLPAIILLMMYNGNRGKQFKYFFYFFYPAHLTLLWIIKEIFIK